jgi:hypothetical protein
MFPPKCKIAARKIEFLDHIVTATMTLPSLDQIQAIFDIPKRRTLSQANRFFR